MSIGIIGRDFYFRQGIIDSLTNAGVQSERTWVFAKMILIKLKDIVAEQYLKFVSILLLGEVPGLV